VKTSDFHEILYTAADFELDERDVIKNEEVALDRLRVRQNVFIVQSVARRGLQITNCIKCTTATLTLEKSHSLII